MVKRLVSELKPYAKNKELFGDLNKGEFARLKEDINQNKLLHDPHILPNGTILCGHQRVRAIKELGWKEVNCVVINHLKTPDEIEFYVIRENVFRRQLAKEQQYIVFARASELNEKGRGGDRHSKEFKDATVASLKEDVNALTAKQFNVSRKTIANARKYKKAIKENPELKKKKVTAVLKHVNKKEKEKKIKKMKPVTGEYNLIVIDPPWRWEGSKDPDSWRGAANYPMQTIDELKKINIPSAKDCVLWVWGIDVLLKETLELIEHWGFERKNTLIWNKDSIGLGQWLRNQHEYCFLAIKGKPLFKGENFPSVLSVSRRKHSEKPTEFYDLVAKASPYPAKLDYYARKKRDGWDVYGDEV